jgi:hypothetical protein
VIVGSEDGLLTAIDVTRRRRVWQVQAHDGQVSAVAIDARHGVVASGGIDGDVHLRSASTGEPFRTMVSDNGRVRSLVFASGGAMLAAAGYCRTRTWNLTDPRQPPRDFGGAEGMTDLDVRPDGAFMVTCHGSSGHVRLWHLGADARSDAWTVPRGGVAGLAVEAGGPELMAAGTEGSLTAWRLGQTAPRLTWEADGAVGAIALSDSGRWLATVGARGTAALWDARDGRRLADLPDAGVSRAVVFADADRRLVVGEFDGSLVTWDVANGTVGNMRRAHMRDGEVLALAAHGTRLFVAHRERLVVAHDLTTGHVIGEFTPSSRRFPSRSVLTDAWSRRAHGLAPSTSGGSTRGERSRVSSVRRRSPVDSHSVPTARSLRSRAATDRRVSGIWGRGSGWRRLPKEKAAPSACAFWTAAVWPSATLTAPSKSATSITSSATPPARRSIS